MWAASSARVGQRPTIARVLFAGDVVNVFPRVVSIHRPCGYEPHTLATAPLGSLWCNYVAPRLKYRACARVAHHCGESFVRNLHTVLVLPSVHTRNS
eukprot:COSAG03_NODE_1396_length_4168_cov_2.734333_2_plen_97_part_00